LAKFLNQPVWTVDNLKVIGGNQLIIIGKPKSISASQAKAISFDGRGDGILINDNPIAGAGAFTIEAIFRPEDGGGFEQRWLHVQEDGRENRALLEIRSKDGEWFLDTFINSASNKLTLYSEKFKHPLGRWYHVALVYDGVTMKDYVDGQEEMSGPLNASPLGAGKTSLGVRMNQVSWFRGAIRKIRFTRRALTPAEFMKD